jgi:hypothetical protein
LFSLQADDLKFMNDKRMTDPLQVAGCHDDCDEGSFGSSSSGGLYALIGNARFLSSTLSSHHFFAFRTSNYRRAATASHRVIESIGVTPAPQSKKPRRSGVFALRQTETQASVGCE